MVAAVTSAHSIRRHAVCALSRSNPAASERRAGDGLVVWDRICAVQTKRGLDQEDGRLRLDKMHKGPPPTDRGDTMGPDRRQ
jgi:hypothetical protein